jgi:hypothetical protein
VAEDRRPAALLIDIEKRHFHLLGQTFNAQDFWLSFFFVSGLGFALFSARWGVRPRVVRLRVSADRLPRGCVPPHRTLDRRPGRGAAKLDKAPFGGPGRGGAASKMVVFAAIARGDLAQLSSATSCRWRCSSKR